MKTYFKPAQVFWTLIVFISLIFYANVSIYFETLIETIKR